MGSSFFELSKNKVETRGANEIFRRNLCIGIAIDYRRGRGLKKDLIIKWSRRREKFVDHLVLWDMQEKWVPNFWNFFPITIIFETEPKDDKGIALEKNQHFWDEM